MTEITITNAATESTGTIKVISEPITLARQHVAALAELVRWYERLFDTASQEFPPEIKMQFENVKFHTHKLLIEEIEPLLKVKE